MALEMISTAPDVQAQLHAMRYENLTWAVGLSEVIDNAFDAGATQVRIRIESKSMVQVIDDGSGANVEALVAMVTPFKHLESRRQTVGMYGIGLKNFAVWLWSRMGVLSIHGGKAREIECDWPNLSAWEVNPPAESSIPLALQAGLVEGRGTSIRFEQITGREIPNGKGMEALIAKIGETFSPALRAGKQIRITDRRRKALRTFLVPAPEAPPISDRVDVNLKLSCGDVRVVAGVVDEGHRNPVPGLSILFRHRAIQTRSAIGCREYSVARIWGEITLEGQWRLEKNKRQIGQAMSDADQELLFHALEPVLEKGAKQSKHLEIENIKRRLNIGLEEWLRTGKQKRTTTKDGDNGGVEPVGSGRRLRTASVGTADKSADVEIPRKRAKRPRGLMIDLVDLGGDLAYQVNLDSGRVLLNRDAPFVKRMIADGNEDAIRCVAFVAFAHAVIDARGGQLDLPLEGTPIERLSNALFSLRPWSSMSDERVGDCDV